MNTYFTDINKIWSVSTDTNIIPIIECKVDDPAYLPVRAHPTDAGADLKSTHHEDIYPGETKLIDTGVAVKIPKGYGGFVFNRSGQGKQGIILPNSVGVIDSDYRGNIKVPLKNLSDSPYKIKPGDRIAQLVIMPVLLVGFVDAWNDTERGSGGFGSTGK